MKLRAALCASILLVLTGCPGGGDARDSGADEPIVEDNPVFDASAPDVATDAPDAVATDTLFDDQVDASTTDSGTPEDVVPTDVAMDASSDALDDAASTDVPEIDMGCVSCAPVPAPRLIAPLSTATVTSQTPTFHWSLATGSDGAQVDICHDRACSTVVATFSASGSSGVPSSALAAGVYFWRARGTQGGVAGSDSSPVWQFVVGARSAPVDTSWGTSPDLDGDGYSDVAVGEPLGVGQAGRVFLYAGSATGLVTTPRTIAGPDGGTAEFGSSVASAGDVNGDGFADLIVGAYRANGGNGRVYMFFGSAIGIADVPDVTLDSPPGGIAQFGTVVSAVGDVNGDGYGDVAVTASMGNQSSAYVFLGGSAGTSATAATFLVKAGLSSTGFGAIVASAGDVNGDGYGDLALADPSSNTETGRVELYLGSAAGIAMVPSLVLQGPDGSSSYFGFSIANAGDVNGDGYAELVVGELGYSDITGRAFIYRGSATGLATTPTTTLTGPSTLSFVGGSVTGAGDLNGDGFADVAVGAGGFNSRTGRVYVLLGSATSTSGATPLNGPDGPDGAFGVPVVSAGDIDRDGISELLIGAPGVMSNTGRAYVYPGLATTPSVTLEGTDGTNANFGNALALAPSQSPRSRRGRDASNSVALVVRLTRMRPARRAERALAARL